MATKKKTKTLLQLKNILDTRFSRFIRIRDSNKNGIISCITCKSKIPRKKAHNCHFIWRANYKYRRDERNCNAWCCSCNTYHQERHQQVYTLIMIDRYWRKRVDEAMASNHKINSIKKYIIEEKIEKYKALVNSSNLYP